METDLISVLIPAYNVGKYLKRCLRSVMRQTYQNLEIVVVDDGSTDDTLAVAQKQAAQDPRIVVLQKTNENSIAKTRNFLLDHFHGKYCVWVDSDDYVKPNYVEKLHTALVMYNADLSVCRFTLQVIPNVSLRPSLTNKIKIFRGEQIVPQLVYQRGFQVWNKMYRADRLTGLRFDTTVCFGEDLLFNMAYARNCQTVVCLPERLYKYAWRAGSEMHQKFSTKQISFVDRLLELCRTETDPIMRDALRGWAAFTCCEYVFLADRKRYPDAVARMKIYTHEYCNDLFRSPLPKFPVKLVVGLGIHTWCRQKKAKTTQTI